MKTIQSFVDWIFAPPSQRAYVWLPLTIVVFDVVYGITLASFKTSFDIGTTDLPRPHLVPIASLAFVYTVLYISLVEELIFRIIPLIILLKTVRSRIVTIAALLALSVVFGLEHHGWESIPAQGLSGLLYSIVFIKYSEHGTKLLQPSLIVILMHTIFNATVSILYVVVNGGTMF